MLDGLIILVTAVTAAALLHPALAGRRLWRAAITPLASIIGSGFLVLGPILDTSFGRSAPLVMALLCGIAYLFGAAIRFNIARLDDPAVTRSATEARLEWGASWALAFAYVVSVTYYLNLFGAFAVSMTESDDSFHARLVTSGMFGIIALVGWTRGFSALERLEQVSVGMKLSIIAGLLFGLAWHFVQVASDGALVANPASVQGWPAIALVFGLLITVQGFETSRYLGEDYDAATRIRSMRLAQLLSSAIYMVYILLLVFAFPPDTVPLSETAVIHVLAIVAPILPVLLITAALTAQFSAAVADTGGSGGLMSELTHHRMAPRTGYLVLTVAGVLLTWTLSVFEIIGYASRAFALYYALQALIAARGSWVEPARRRSALAYGVLAGLGLAIAVFGAGVE